MVEKISVQIALEGGAEVARQLEDIGQAGQKAFADLANSAQQVGGFKNLKPEAVTAKLQQMGITGVDAINKIEQAVRSAGRLEGIVQGVEAVEAGFATLGRAAGPIGAALVAGFAAAAKAAYDFLNSLNAINDAAAKAGMSVQQYDQLSQALKAAGVSAKGTASILQSMGEAMQKAQVDKVTTAFKELQEASQRGFGVVGTRQLQQLEQAAHKATDEGKAAREALVKLGQPIPTDAPKTFQEIAAESSSAEEALRKYIAQLQQMPPSGGRAALVLRDFKDAGLELLAALQTGTIDQFFAKLQQQSKITEEQVIAAERQRQAINQMSAAWEQFKATVIAPVAVPLLQGIMEAGPAILSAFQQLGTALSAIGQVVASVGQSIVAGFAPLGAALISIGQIIGSVASSIMSGFAPLGAALTSIGQVAASVASSILSGFAPIGQALTDIGSVALSIGQSFVQGFALIGAAITKAGAALASFASAVAGFVWGPIEAGIALWNSITGAIQAAIDKLKEFLKLLPGGAGGPKLGEAGGVQIGGAARGGLIGGRGTGTSDSNLAWVSRGEYVVNAAAVRHFGAGFFAALNGGNIPGFQAGGVVGPKAGERVIVSGTFFGQLDGWIRKLESALGGIGSAMTKLIDENARMLMAHSGELRRAQDNIVDVMVALGELSQRVAQGREAAGGGLIGGRGTGTSDSNLAWVSRGEFVINAAMVRRFGAQFFALLNAGIMPGFALGGLVPAFAGGGPAGMSHVTIQFPGLPPIAGLRASSEVVGELQRAAALAQVRSGGRKPSRYS